MMEDDERLSRAGAMKCADAGDGDASDLSGNSRGRGGGEEKLIILAAMESGMKSIFRGKRTGKRVERDGAGVDLGADA
jgi:hypothetical protein